VKVHTILCCLPIQGPNSAYVDAIDLKTRTSVTDLLLYYVGGCVAHKSELQVTVAEFSAAVSAVKIIKYLCYVLQEIELMEPELMLYIDNQAAMHMINDTKPTPCLCHFDIKHFAVQEWHDAGILKTVCIPDVINPSDAATKATTSQLHHYHV
jgi:hypothetical protein